MKTKYQGVLDLSQKLNIKNVDIKKENWKQLITETAKTQCGKNLIWDKIKEISADIAADIIAKVSSNIANHTVKSL